MLTADEGQTDDDRHFCHKLLSVTLIAIFINDNDLMMMIMLMVKLVISLKNW